MTPKNLLNENTFVRENTTACRCYYFFFKLIETKFVKFERCIRVSPGIFYGKYPPPLFLLLPGPVKA